MVVQTYSGRSPDNFYNPYGEPIRDARRRMIETTRRFEQEAQATASLRSPHTVELYDFGRAEDGAFYYVMEYLDGADLARLVRRDGPVEIYRAISAILDCPVPPLVV